MSSVIKVLRFQLEHLGFLYFRAARLCPREKCCSFLRECDQLFSVRRQEKGAWFSSAGREKKIPPEDDEWLQSGHGHTSVETGDQLFTAKRGVLCPVILQGGLVCVRPNSEINSAGFCRLAPPQVKIGRFVVRAFVTYPPPPFILVHRNVNLRVTPPAL